MIRYNFARFFCYHILAILIRRGSGKDFPTFLRKANVGTWLSKHLPVILGWYLRTCARSLHVSLPSTLTCLSHTGHQVASHDCYIENRADYERSRRLETGVRILWQILASSNERVSLRWLTRNGYLVILPIYRLQIWRILSRSRMIRYLIIRWRVIWHGHENITSPRSNRPPRSEISERKRERESRV